ncbi:MAG: AAA family ATPase [Chloroflexi bacterium]|nr:AAA family ATPase [Chloroflexota bacterium]
MELGPLNVLVGPNGSGKSNLLEIFDLLRYLPRDLQEFARISGGPRDWIWKGKPPETGKPDVARIETVLDNPTSDVSESMALRHIIDITSSGPQFGVVEERFENESPYPGYDRPYFYFDVKDGFGRLNRHQGTVGTSAPGDAGDEDVSRISPDNAQPGQSIFRERRDPEDFPVVTATARFFERFRLYRDWNSGRSSAVRQPQPADGPPVDLEENFSNLALVINNLQGAGARRIIDDHMTRFYENYEGVHASVAAGSIQLTTLEHGFPTGIPATRLSDGTIKFIALLAILCNPEPPPLVCLEEPEIGLHPDIIPLVGDLLKSLAEKTQLFVTTHSSQLLDEFTDTPESVIIFERDFDNSTEMKRLDKDQLEIWLEDYTLGRLWEKGQIGGKRW